MKAIGITYSDERKSLVKDELQRILDSKEFANAPVVRAFLEFVVNETLVGRGDQIKAYTIATEVFGRGSQFDPSSDTIVRTTAGRVRRALEAYNGECERNARVVLDLPKGGYVPAFEFRDAPPSPQPNMSARSSRMHQPFSRPGPLMAAYIFAVLALGFTALFWWGSEQKSLPNNIVIDVRPVQYVGLEAQSLARAIDIRLAPALSQIQLAKISPPSVSPSAKEAALATAGANTITFILKANIIKDAEVNLYWQLINAETGHLIWASTEQLSEGNQSFIDKVVSDISFQVLGEGGAVPLTLAKYHGSIFTKQTCLSRAQLMRAVENASVYPEMRECLERIVARFPNDASAWAILSTFYTVRTRYFATTNPEQRASLIKLAEHAAAKAEVFAPDAYLTKVALMQVALRQRRVSEFDRLQKQIRAEYPGDIYLKLRIGSRIARLGRGQEALAIYDEARKERGISLRPRAAEIALAYFVEGNYERAQREIARTTSSQRYVLILKAAILGKLGMAEQAAPVIDELVAANPDIEETFYPWFTELSWVRPLLVEIADGLAKVGLIVESNHTNGLVNFTGR